MITSIQLANKWLKRLNIKEKKKFGKNQKPMLQANIKRNKKSAIISDFVLSI